jgi:hypothetical protein
MRFFRALDSYLNTFPHRRGGCRFKMTALIRRHLRAVQLVFVAFPLNPASKGSYGN